MNFKTQHFTIKLFLISLLISAAYMMMHRNQIALLRYNYLYRFHFYDRNVKAVVEGPYIKIQHIFKYLNPQRNLVEATFTFPQTENDIFHEIDVKIGHTGKFKKVFQEINDPKKDFNLIATETGERFLERLISIGKVKDERIIEVIFTVTKPLKVLLNKFYELNLRAFSRMFDDESPTPYESWMHWNIELLIKSDSPFTLLSNPTHNIEPKLSKESAEFSAGMVYKAFYRARVVFFTDFKVYFAFDAPQAIMTTHPDNPHDHAFMFSLIPSIHNLPSADIQKIFQKRDVYMSLLEFKRDVDNNFKRDVDSNLLGFKRAVIQSGLRSFPSEYLFVIDRSSSMGDDLYFKRLKKTLNIFLDILSKQVSYFSILSFGSTLELHDDTFEKLPEQTLQVMKWVETLEADMGGKDLKSALEYAFKEYEWTSLPQNVIILTNAKDINIQKISDLVSANSNSRKICAMDFGDRSDRSEYFINLIGDAGGCPSDLPYDDKDLENKLLNTMMSTLLTPGLNLAYKITCENKQNKVVYQEEAGFQEIATDKAFTKWVTLENTPDLKSCKAQIFYYNQQKCYSSEKEIEVFSSQATKLTTSWQKILSHSKLEEKSQQNSTVKRTELSYPQSSYGTYREQFKSESCRNLTRSSLFNSSGNLPEKRSKPQQNGIFSFISAETIYVVAICILLFALGYFVRLS